MTMMKEQQRRLSKGTLVVAIAKYEAQCSKVNTALVFLINFINTNELFILV